MSGSLPKYSSGGFGPKSNPLSFSDINRITRATEIVEGMNVGQKSGRGKPRSHFFASLVSQEGTYGGKPLWHWSQIGGDDSGLSSLEGLLASAQYEDGQGLAIQLSETASAGDNVLMHEIPCTDGVRRFAFGSGGADAGEDDGPALLITGQTEVGTNRWQYTVVEGFISASGAFVSSEPVIGGIMWNLYEKETYGHGQGLSFTNGTLVVGHLEGIVFGGLSTVEDGTRVYVCDVPNPMVPQCNEELSDAPGASFSFPVSSKAYQVMMGGI